ncbi:alpha/beta hydrolase [Paenibacillus sp. JX-17]|uniref:Alpha/beta hydrolase n=1 Tax=Paenibacillus lacisoli TaxID=3064525 RepID=A0ABT9C985_9BACL|nr:alpha/beta hydrolase [Paenibacillus sp. JX-17]MDO7905229.1 alpha/beta hydrolase [Paenibacillus sp. JX-17]
MPLLPMISKAGSTGDPQPGLTGIPIIETLLRTGISILGCPLTLTQHIVSVWRNSSYLPKGQMVNIGGRQLHAHLSGEGRVTVILESGMGGCSLDWTFVQPELSRHAAVLSYDRAGFGWSDPGREAPTCRQAVKDLRVLLQKLKLRPPYLLVGHSYGGMMMRLFASLYPDDVLGLVLVDATHEQRLLPTGMSMTRRRQVNRHRQQLRMGYLCSPVMLPRLLKRPVGSRRLPDEAGCMSRWLGYQNKAYKQAYWEQLCAEASALQLQQAQPLPRELPVMVLTAGLQSEEWKEDQHALLELTDRTEQWLVEDSRHSIQIDRPQTVMQAIKRLLY